MPVDAVAVLKAVPRVANRRSAPCDMQREVAAQNSALDSGITGKPVTYAAPCDFAPGDTRAPSGRLPAGESEGAKKTS